MKYRYYIFILIILLASCDKKAPELTPAQVKVKADSIIKIKVGDLTRQYNEDLEKRLVVEVKGKADSIVEAARKKEHPGGDTIVVNKPDMGARPNARKLDTARRNMMTREP